MPLIDFASAAVRASDTEWFIIIYVQGEREREREKKGVAAAAAAAAAAAITEESWEEIGNSKRVVGWHNSSINNVSGFSTEGDAKKYEVKISFRTSDNPD
jgi:hypothetical protein